MRTFQAVVRARSFTGAAAELGYVQSTVTAHVQSLERQLGTRLLDRLPSGAVPTAAGLRLMPAAGDLLALEERLRREVPEATGPLSGAVTLVAPESLCAHQLPVLIAAMREHAPGVRLALRPAGTARALQGVRDGEVDAALVVDAGLSAPDLRVRHVRDLPLAVLAAPSSPLTRGRRSWADVAQECALLLEEGCSYSDAAATLLAAAGQPPVKRSRFGSVETVKRCAATGLGVTVLPVVTAERDLADGTLAVVAGPELPDHAVVLVTHPGRTSTPAVDLLVDLAMDLLGGPAGARPRQVA
nr:LysR family transcriptional regulator [Modestobacter versicolor]